MKKKQNNLKSWFSAKLHEIWWLPWQRQKWDTHNKHMKMFPGDGWTANESFSPLEQITNY